MGDDAPIGAAAKPSKVLNATYHLPAWRSAQYRYLSASERRSVGLTTFAAHGISIFEDLLLDTLSYSKVLKVRSYSFAKLEQ